MSAKWPPALNDPESGYIAAHNMLKAHSQVYQLFKNNYK